MSEIGAGNGPRACRVPDAGIDPSAWADGTARQLAWGHGTSGSSTRVATCSTLNQHKSMMGCSSQFIGVGSSRDPKGASGRSTSKWYESS